MTTDTGAAAVAAREADEASITLMAEVEAFEITNPDQYTASGELLREIKTRQKAVASTRTGITKPMDAAKKTVMDLFNPVSMRLIAAEQTIKAAMLIFSRAEEQRQREEQARLDEAARKERERLASRAATARTGGHDEKAEVLEQTAEVTQAPKAEAATKAEGVHTTTTWHAEVDNIQELIEWAAANAGGYDYLQPNMKALNEAARALKGHMAIPGVRAVPETNVAARAH